MRERCYVGMTVFYVAREGGELHFKCLCNNTTVIDLKQEFIPEYYVKYPPVSKMHVFFSQILQYKCTTLATFSHINNITRV